MRDFTSCLPLQSFYIFTVCPEQASWKFPRSKDATRLIAHPNKYDRNAYHQAELTRYPISFPGFSGNPLPLNQLKEGITYPESMLSPTRTQEENFTFTDEDNVFL